MHSHICVLRLEANLVADRLADLFVALGGHAFGRVAHEQPDATRREPMQCSDIHVCSYVRVQYTCTGEFAIVLYMCSKSKWLPMRQSAEDAAGARRRRAVGEQHLRQLSGEADAGLRRDHQHAAVLAHEAQQLAAARLQRAVYTRSAGGGGGTRAGTGATERGARRHLWHAAAYTCSDCSVQNCTVLWCIYT